MALTLGNGVITFGDSTVQTTSAFTTGTVVVFGQGYAPTGWTQNISDSANNRMLRVVNGVGGGVGGGHDPTYMNVVPPHTHGVSVGTVSADHSHNDAGHYHYFVWQQPEAPSDGDYQVGGASATRRTDKGGWTHYAYASLGGMTANHVHSGGTDNGSSQTCWSPRYINIILCTKN